MATSRTPRSCSSRCKAPGALPAGAALPARHSCAPSSARGLCTSAHPPVRELLLGCRGEIEADPLRESRECKYNDQGYDKPGSVYIREQVVRECRNRRYVLPEGVEQEQYSDQRYDDFPPRCPPPADEEVAYRSGIGHDIRGQIKESRESSEPEEDVQVRRRREYAQAKHAREGSDHEHRERGGWIPGPRGGHSQLPGHEPVPAHGVEDPGASRDEPDRAGEGADERAEVDRVRHPGADVHSRKLANRRGRSGEFLYSWRARPEPPDLGAHG